MRVTVAVASETFSLAETVRCKETSERNRIWFCTLGKCRGYQAFYVRRSMDEHSLDSNRSIDYGKQTETAEIRRNKNIVVIGGSGSGKTRFFVKPSVMQMNCSMVITDPKGTLIEECGKMLVKGPPKRDKDGNIIKINPEKWYMNHM